MDHTTPTRAASPPLPVPGSAQALWQRTLEQLRTTGSERLAALWSQTTPVARSPEAFTVAAPSAFARTQLSARERHGPLSAALQQAAGAPLRLTCVVGSTAADEEDPLIRAVLARINALNTPRTGAHGIGP